MRSSRDRDYSPASFPVLIVAMADVEEFEENESKPGEDQANGVSDRKMRSLRLAQRSLEATGPVGGFLY